MKTLKTYFEGLLDSDPSDISGDGLALKLDDLELACGFKIQGNHIIPTDNLYLNRSWRDNTLEDFLEITRGYTIQSKHAIFIKSFDGHDLNINGLVLESPSRIAIQAGGTLTMNDSNISAKWLEISAENIAQGKRNVLNVKDKLVVECDNINLDEENQIKVLHNMGFNLKNKNCDIYLDTCDI